MNKELLTRHSYIITILCLLLKLGTSCILTGFVGFPGFDELEEFAASEYLDRLGGCGYLERFRWVEKFDWVASYTHLFITCL